MIEIAVLPHHFGGLCAEEALEKASKGSLFHLPFGCCLDFLDNKEGSTASQSTDRFVAFPHNHKSPGMGEVSICCLVAGHRLDGPTLFLLPLSAADVEVFAMADMRKKQIGLLKSIPG
jgi:hypothetical protein